MFGHLSSADSMRAARPFFIVGLLLASSAFSGCAVMKQAYAPNPQPAPPFPIMPQADPAPAEVAGLDGSLWPAKGYWNLFADNKALRRGDIVQVVVNQKNSGTKDASTATTRDASISGTIKKFFGFEDEIQKATTKDPELVSVTSSNSFKGNGTTARKDDLSATVSAIVTDVLADGNLVIYGHQIVTVNNEASVLTVQGIVRPTDIGRGNSIDAGRIANARIQFDGSGVVTDKQHPGWAMRAFDWVWPF